MRTALAVSAAPLATLVDRARDYAADGCATSTKKVYLSDFRSFHRSERVARTCVRHAKLFDDNAAGGLF